MVVLLTACRRQRRRGHICSGRPLQYLGVVLRAIITQVVCINVLGYQVVLIAPVMNLKCWAGRAAVPTPLLRSGAGRGCAPYSAARPPPRTAARSEPPPGGVQLARAMRRPPAMPRGHGRCHHLPPAVAARRCRGQRWRCHYYRAKCLRCTYGPVVMHPFNALLEGIWHGHGHGLFPGGRSKFAAPWLAPRPHYDDSPR